LPVGASRETPVQAETAVEQADTAAQAETAVEQADTAAQAETPLKTDIPRASIVSPGPVSQFGRRGSGITWILDGLEVTLAGALSGALKQSPTLQFRTPTSGSPAAPISLAPCWARYSSAG